MDYSLFHDAASQAPQVAAVCKPIIRTVIKSVPLLIGVTYKTAFLSSLVSFVVGGALAWWYVKPKAAVIAAVTPVIDEVKADVAKV